MGEAAPVQFGQRGDQGRSQRGAVGGAGDAMREQGLQGYPLDPFHHQEDLRPAREGIVDRGYAGHG